MLAMAAGLMAASISGVTCLAADPRPQTAKDGQPMSFIDSASSSNSSRISVFLCGDVMTGRGIDQILPHPSAPAIHEAYMRSASGYVQLAEKVSGAIPRAADPSYIWGDALTVLGRIKPDLRLINLETSITASEDYWPKGINYRMHPDNIACLSAARIDGCVLANNHVLDWGPAGLADTLEVLQQAYIKTAGAGMNRKQAQAPAIFDLGAKGRLLVFACGAETSGIPAAWAAQEASPGVNLLADYSSRTVQRIKEAVAAVKQPGDVALLSIHCGANWGYAISPKERQFAHDLLDQAHVDAIYGHSSHHVKAAEVHQDKLILYGCGDFLNDYEGIEGHEGYRADLALMYVPTFDSASGRLVELIMIPMQIRRFQTIRATSADSRWLMDLLNREGRPLGTQVRQQADASLKLAWHNRLDEDR
jgi:poly-gamma-glutamate capsule biosynthesis protein CapA/YwtB (metallophosphatase superfamily)